MPSFQQRRLLGGKDDVLLVRSYHDDNLDDKKGAFFTVTESIARRMSVWQKHM